jgi:hypothetical protein
MDETTNGYGAGNGADLADEDATHNDFAYAEQYDPSGDTEVVGTFD